MKTYIGSGKQHTEYKGVITVSIEVDKAEQFFFKADNGKRYLRFDVAEKKAPDQYGKTHSVSVWTPDGQQQSAPMTTGVTTGNKQLYPDAGYENAPLPTEAPRSSFDDSDICF